MLVGLGNKHKHSIIKNSAKSFVLVSVILSGPSTPRRAPPRHTRFRRVTMNENSRHSASAQELRFSFPPQKTYKLRVGINFHGATAVIYIYSTQIQCFQHPLHFRIPSLISDISGCHFFSFLGKWNRRLDGGLNKTPPSYSSESTNLEPTIFYGTPRH